MATTKRSRKAASEEAKQSTPADFTFVGFANVDIPEEAYAMIDGASVVGQSALVSGIDAGLVDDVKFSVYFDAASASYRAQFVAFGGQNSGLILTANGPTLEGAIACLLWKHDHVDRQWPLPSVRQGHKYR